jgi:cytochrome c biogenesis protein
LEIKKKEKSTLINRVWRLFTSIRLALFLLFLLALLSIIGTIIPQGRSEAFYITSYGEKAASWIIKGDFNKMYNSWWFSFILALFALNTIVCTLERFPIKWKIFKRGELDQSLQYISTIPNYACFDLVSAKEEKIVRRNIDGVLRSRNYKIQDMAESSPVGMAFKAYKGRLNRFGSDIVHLGLIIILLGGIIGSITGFKEYKPIPVGDTVKVDSLENDFQIRANRFWIEHYDTGEVKQYYSDVTLIKEGEEVVKHGIIYVNKPLVYKGIWLYQTSYGDAWDRVEDITLTLFDRKRDKETGSPFKIKWGELAAIPAAKGYEVKPVAFIADFAIDTINKTWYPKSTKHDNPAVQLEIYKNGKLVTDNWVFLNFPNIFPIFGEKDNKNIILKSYTPVPFTALNVVRDRGVTTVWLGSALMIIGLYLSFFVHYRRIWIIVDMKRKHPFIHMAGSTHRDKVSFDKEFKGIVEAIQNNIK